MSYHALDPAVKRELQRRLSDKQLLCWGLKKNGHGWEDISLWLDISIRTVRMHHDRAEQKYNQILEEIIDKRAEEAA